MISSDRLARMTVDPHSSVKAGPSGTLRHRFLAHLPSALVSPKLGGFIAHHEAKVVDQSTDTITLQIGKRGPWSWIRSDRQLPVDVTIRLNREADRSGLLTGVTAELRPRGGVANRRAFRQCIALIRALRYSFMAQDFERGLTSRRFPPLASNCIAT